MTDNFIDDIEFLSLTRDEIIEAMGIVKKILRNLPKETNSTFHIILALLW